MRRTTSLAVLTALMMLVAAVPAQAHGTHSAERDVRKQIAQARHATARYQRVSKATRDGFVPFAIPETVGGTLLKIRGQDITCFDSPTGGMGVHYVRNIDANLDPADPEALVYEVGKHGRLRLVALEYIIPEEFVDPANPPVLFGQELHHHSYLPVYVLHLWAWRWNPSGMFADFNPKVRDCPST